jgi:uncharacterized C2H2 Zn-finger protein
MIRHVAWARYGKTMLCRRPKCFQMFANGDERNKHIAQVHGLLKCPDCDEQFAMVSSLAAHKLTAHATVVEPGTFTCAVCDKDDFVDKGHHEAHERTCRSIANEKVRVGVSRREMQGYRLRATVGTRKRPSRPTSTSQISPACSVCYFKLPSEAERDAHERSCHERKNGGYVCPLVFVGRLFIAIFLTVAIVIQLTSTSATR